MMASCDMCGRSTETAKALVEGVQMDVCKECSRFGKLIRAPDVKKVLAENKFNRMNNRSKKPEDEMVESVIDDYSARIRKSRERMGLTQEEFAKMINERESVVQKMETNQYKPPLNLARKLERILQIKLIEEVKAEGALTQKNDSNTLTIGDIMSQKH